MAAERLLLHEGLSMNWLSTPRVYTEAHGFGSVDMGLTSWRCCPWNNLLNTLTYSQIESVIVFCLVRFSCRLHHYERSICIESRLLQVDRERNKEHSKRKLEKSISSYLSLGSLTMLLHQMSPRVWVNSSPFFTCQVREVINYGRHLFPASVARDGRTISPRPSSQGPFHLIPLYSIQMTKLCCCLCWWYCHCTQYFADICVYFCDLLPMLWLHCFIAKYLHLR